MFCRFCGATISNDDVFCKQCGKRLRETSLPTTQEAAKTEETMAPLPAPTRDAPEVSHDPIRVFTYKHSKLGWTIIGVTLVIVIGLIVGVIITQAGNLIPSLGYSAPPTPVATTAAPVDASAVVGSWAGHCADPGWQTFDSVAFHADGSGTFGDGENILWSLENNNTEIDINAITTITQLWGIAISGNTMTLSDTSPSNTGHGNGYTCTLTRTGS